MMHAFRAIMSLLGRRSNFDSLELPALNTMVSAAGPQYWENNWISKTFEYLSLIFGISVSFDDCV